jgi:hypothetical protein
MVIKTKISTITAFIATIAAIAALGSIGGGIGLGQQQTAIAQELNLDEVDDLLDDIGSEEREICEDFQLPNQPITICFRPPDALPCIGGVLAEIARGDIGGDVPPIFTCS